MKYQKGILLIEGLMVLPLIFLVFIFLFFIPILHIKKWNSLYAEEELKICQEFLPHEQCLSRDKKLIEGLEIFKFRPLNRFKNLDSKPDLEIK
jgi:uncharacterized membrane protein